MNQVIIKGKEYPIIGTGECIMIFRDELHADVFKAMAHFTTELLNGNVPNVSDTSMLMYAFIKCANSELFPNYKTFLTSTNVGTFVDTRNLNNLLEAISDELDTGTEEKKEDEEKKQ